MEIASGSDVKRFKVVLLGEGCVGKTCMVLRYIENKFANKHVSTLQAAFFTKKLNIAGKRVELSIWDTAGQERFHALGPIYYRDSQGAVLVYDITDEDSFQKVLDKNRVVVGGQTGPLFVKNWVKELRKMLGDNVQLVIAGNKTDLDKDRRVPVAEAEEYAQQVGAKHHSTSAKLNKGVEELFFDLTKNMLEEAERNHATLERQSSLRRRGNVTVVDDAQGQKEKKTCC